MVKVTICPLGYLGAPFGKRNLEVEVEEGTAVSEVLTTLAVRTDLVVAVVINDVTAKMSSVLSEGDVVKLIPVISGG